MSFAVANLCSRYGCHTGTGHALLIGGFGVAFDLAQARVTADRGDDVGGATGLGQPATGCLLSPWAVQCFGSPAAWQYSRNRWPNPAAVNGRPYSVTR